MSEENKSQDSKEVEKVQSETKDNQTSSEKGAAQETTENQNLANQETELDENEDKTATAIIEESNGMPPLKDVSKEGNINEQKKEYVEKKEVIKEIEKKDYTVLSKEELIKELQHLIKNEKVIDIKEQVEEINTAINAQFNAEQEEAKASFLEEGGNIIDFRFYSPLKKDFNEVYYEYRNKRQEFFERKRKDQNANLAERQNIIEDIKALRDELGGAESVNLTFNKFKDIQERWNNAGNIPRDRYNLVWNDYYFHVDAFYELLHLNREFRDKHFEDNLVKKIQLIQRAEELSAESNINKAFKELQLLHRMWKEEIGPVSKQYSDEIWDQFSAATKKIHDARDEKQKEIDAVWEKNLEEKKQLIANILELAQDDIKAHKTVQEKIKKVEALRDAFFKAGKVPRDKNEETWSAFKEATKLFNQKKNNFYKSQKKEQYDNLEAKKALIKIAQENKENEDIPATLDIMKRIQAEWKNIGHVPRKDSDKVWNEFKSACNYFFDRMKDSKKQDRAGEQENYEQKIALMQTLKDVNLTGERTTDLATIKEYIAQWKSIGRVPYAKKNIDQDFNKILDGFFKKLDIDRKEAELIKYENRMQTMADGDNERAIEKERFFIRKKIDEVKSEINQLENNLGFFQHVPDDNPMVMEVHKNINKHKEDLALWKSKLKKLRAVVAESQKDEEPQQTQENDEEANDAALEA